MNSHLRPFWSLVIGAVLSLGITACEKQGPLERTGEEVDEAIDTAKRGGEESTENKVDDAIDEAREGAKDTADELKEK